MTVLRRFLRDRRRGFIGWTAGITLGVGIQNAFYPAFKEQMKELGNTFEQMEGLFGLSESAPIFTPPGWIQAQVFAFLPVLIAIYAVSLGARALVTSEEDGTLELMLAQPIDRVRLALERFGGFAVLVPTVTFMSCLLMLASTPPLGLTEGVSIPGYLAATFGAAALGLLFGSVTFAIGAATGRRALALTIGAVFAVASYVINGLAQTVNAAKGLRFFTPFHWYLGRNMLVDGIAVEALTLPLVIAAACAAFGIWRFRHRDLHTS